jgi:glucosyl-3-phosphoglycerate synthase
MISVIIPTLNEQSTISHVVQLVKKAPLVTEILVIDDKSLDNTLKKVSNSVATGEVKIPSVFIKTKESNCNHDFCKSNAMREIANRYKIDIMNIIAIGDSESDVCIIKDCGIGIAFCSSNETLNLVASKVISERSFASLVDFIQ